METFDFATQPPVSRDRIYVSWNEQWDVGRYVDDYLASRNLRRDDAARWQVCRCIGQFNPNGPLRKADVDYYLDVNVRRELELPGPVGVRWGSMD